MRLNFKHLTDHQNIYGCLLVHETIVCMDLAIVYRFFLCKFIRDEEKKNTVRFLLVVWNQTKKWYLEKRRRVPSRWTVTRISRYHGAGSDYGSWLVFYDDVWTPTAVASSRYPAWWILSHCWMIQTNYALIRHRWASMYLLEITVSFSARFQKSWPPRAIEKFGYRSVATLFISVGYVRCLTSNT